MRCVACGEAEHAIIGGEKDIDRRLLGTWRSERRRWSCIPLDLDYAFHSAAMDPLRPALLADLAGLRGRPPAVPMISTVTGAALGPAGCTADYWWDNLRQPVRFQAAVEAQARLDILIQDLSAVLNSMEGLTSINSLIKKLRDLEEAERAQYEVLDQLHKQEKEKILKDLGLFEDEKPKDKK